MTIGSNCMSSYGSLCSLFYDATKGYASEEEVTFYAQFMQKSPARILEAMCGSGRLLIPLLQRGYVVDGVDNAPAMLFRCAQRAKALDLNPQVYTDMLETFTSAHHYQTITIAVGSFQLITERAQALAALKNCNRQMIEGGNLLIDVFIPATENSNNKKTVRINNNTILTLATEYIFRKEERKADALCTYQFFSQGQLTQEERELIQITWYTDQEFETLLQEAGFKLSALYEKTFPVTGPSRIVHAIKNTQ